MRTKWRFYYHWVRQTGKWSVHFRGQCIHADDIICKCNAETHKRNTQPYRVMRGYAKEILIGNNSIIIV